MERRHRTVLSLVIAALVAMLAIPTGALAAPGKPGAPRYSAGAPGAGDPYFPYAGNGGYDVQHYDLDITYTPPEPAPAPLVGYLEGVATIDLVATQDLDALNLDLRGMEVERITVDGKRLRETVPPGNARPRRRPVVVARPGRRRADLGAHPATSAEAQGRHVGRGRRRVRRRDDPSARHRGCAVRLGHHP
jgi:hypothetical protein